MRRSMLLIIVSLLFFLSSCKSNGNVVSESISTTILDTDKNELKSQNDKLKAENQLLISEMEKLKEMIFDKSLLDSNIVSYHGLFWSSIEYQFSNYLKSLIQRVLFETDYINIEEVPNTTNPVEEIKKSEDRRNQILGVIYNNPINSSVTSLPREITETWFNSIEHSSYMYLRTSDNGWHTYKVLDGNLQSDYSILLLLVKLTDEINNRPA